ncbi:MAG: S8 family serine peptidase [Euryarchaeota archaeon]|nr:S8 family serine peptidase [Euryarchaeota archaeon]
MNRGSGAVILAIFLILPLPPMPQESGQINGEIIVESSTPWDSEGWQYLLSKNMQPLRQLSATEMLVWGPIEEYNIPESITQYRGKINDYESYFVILEPRLAPSIIEVVIDDLNSINLNPRVVFSVEENSPLSTILVIQPNTPITIWWDYVEIMHGIHWVEPILETTGRNDVAAAIMQSGNMTTQPAWLLGLDGSGVVISNADSGIDRDHACFREATQPGGSGSEWNNATGTPGENHRKIIFLNESIDQWDSPGDENYRHGTHVAGSLVCRSIWEVDAEGRGDWVNATPGEGTSVAHRARLVVEDVVDEDGWHIPEIGDLFWDANRHGGIIRSDSWGDDSTAYTARTSKFDTWLYQVPWSVSFVAPGNTGDEVLEPANGLNVVSVGVSATDGSDDLWTLSPRQQTEQGRMGVTLVVPGEHIMSAKADGIHDSYNDEIRSSTGTSMATPQAAAIAAVVQQMVETGWFLGNESTTIVSTNVLRPDWAETIDENLTQGNVLLGDGFTPSGPLIRALMTLSGDSLEGGRQAELMLGQGPDNQQGWGRVNLSNLVDFNYLNQELNNSTVDPTTNIWIHDSFRLNNNKWKELVSKWVDGDSLDSVSQHRWKGEGAAGPFVSTGDEIVWNMPLMENEDLDVRLVWNSEANIDSRDDLDLVVTLPNGTVILGNDFSNEQIRDEIETIEGVHIDAELLVGIDSVTITIVGQNVNSGPEKNVVGLNGEKIGFAIAVKGVVRKDVETSTPWSITPYQDEENGTQGDELSKINWIIIGSIILIVALSLVFIEMNKWKAVVGDEGTFYECEPSNHEGHSLTTAVAPHTGDDDE